MKQNLEMHITERMLEGSKACVGITLESQHGIFSKSIPKPIKP